MCGIVGYVSQQVKASDKVVEQMANAIRHRGPDGAATWCDVEAGIALGHRRLSIIDLTDFGRQPMHSSDGRFVLLFNGEIYNHRVLRAELEAQGLAPTWQGHSDSEVLLAALASWGAQETLSRLNGMFAFALWDRKFRRLTMARDRMGEKPLYYGLVKGSLLFGSELKALAQHPSWEGTINRNALALFLRFAYVPEPYCIFEGLYKLPPAHVIEIDCNDFSVLPDPTPYWSLQRTANAPRRQESEKLLLDELEEKLMTSIGLRMEADVPLGAFLSGGIDSSAVVALMQAQSAKPVRTFTIGFEVAGYNEAEAAKAIAKHLGTQHTELYLTAQDALNVVPSLPHVWDEPFADSSQIPTLLLSKMTRESVTVALSGDGGDEVFCGYNRYGQGHQLHRRLSMMPSPLRAALGGAMRHAPVQLIDRLMALVPQRYRYPAVGDRLQKLGRVIDTRDMGSFYGTLVTQIHNADELVIGGELPETKVDRQQDWPKLHDFRETMMYLDTLTYLPGDIMTKVDRASMAASLEARAPYLDHELIEFAWTLPMSMKLRDGKTKWALRQILERHVPTQLFERPKMGFGVPIEHWLTGPLKQWAEDLLSPQRLKQQGLLHSERISQMWSEQCSGRGRWHYQLWTVLMFQAWMKNGLGSARLYT